MNKKTAIITGITGQDGPFLAQHLLAEGYKVYGVVRRTAHRDLSFMEEMGIEDVEIVDADLTDSHSLYDLIKNIKPDEFYNLAAQSHVGLSFKQPELTMDVTGLSVSRILEHIHLHSPNTRFYQASSSEMFGDVAEVPQNEKTELRPRSPYGVAKVAGHNAVKVYRESYGIFACSGILFNHEGIRRGKTFVTRKITDWLARWYTGQTNDLLELGNLDAKRDWGDSRSFTKAMMLMLQQDEPGDYVVATGETHSIREFCEVAFSHIGLELKWRGEDLDEVGYLPAGQEFWTCDSSEKEFITNDTEVIKINPEYYRPNEVEFLLGDSTKARDVLGWEPEMNFRELVTWMVDYDVTYQNEIRTFKEIRAAKT